MTPNYIPFNPSSNPVGKAGQVVLRFLQTTNLKTQQSDPSPVPAEARVIRPSSGTSERSLSSLPTTPNFRDDEYFIRHGTPPPPLRTARELHTGGPLRGKSEGGVHWQQACAASETV